MELSFIILTWNSEKYIERCLFSCSQKCEFEGISAEIIIIDNGSSDKTKKIILDQCDTLKLQIHLIELSENKGTTFTRNLGLKKAIGRYICILDSDTELALGSLRSAINRLKEDDKVGIIAPKLTLPDGTTQNSVKRFPTFFQKIKKMPKVLFGWVITEHDLYRDFPFSEETEVNSAISACWLFKKSLIDEIGFLD